MAFIDIVACGGDSITAVARPTPTALPANAATPSLTPTAGPLAAPPPIPGEWTRIAPMLTGRTNHAAVPLPDGSVLVFGAVGPEGFVTASEIYRPDSGVWESAAEMVAPYLLTILPVVFSDGRVVAVGSGTDDNPSTRVQVFDPSAGEWAAMPDLPVAHIKSVAAALPDSSLLVTGGTGRADEILDSAIRLDSLAGESFVPKTFIGLYTPISDSWEMFKMPVWLDGMAVVMLPGGRLLATGGKFGLFDYEPSAWIWVPPSLGGN